MESSSIHKLHPEKMDHVGIVVKDIDKAMETWSSIFDTSPWDIHDMNSTDEDGKPFKVRFANTYIGGIRFELMQTLEGKSTYSSFSDKFGEGLHHISFYVDDIEAEVSNLEAQGAKVLEKGTGRYAYLDKSGLGIIFELLTKGVT